VAVDLSVPRPAAVARAATVPARLLLGGIVAASFLVRYVAALTAYPHLHAAVKPLLTRVREHEHEPETLSPRR